MSSANANVSLTQLFTCAARNGSALVLFPSGLITIVCLVQFAKTPAARLDQAGIATSLLCAIHCAFIPLLWPLLVGLLPLWGLSSLADERTEWLLLWVALCIGVCSLLPGFLRHHRHWQPLLVFVVGAGLMLFVRLGLEEESSLELFGVVVGGILLASAHALNLYYCRQCCVS